MIKKLHYTLTEESKLLLADEDFEFSQSLNSLVLYVETETNTLISVNGKLVSSTPIIEVNSKDQTTKFYN